MPVRSAAAWPLDSSTSIWRVTRSASDSAAASMAPAAEAVPSSQASRASIASGDESSSRSSKRRSPITVAQVG
jgi:hypothetical protein